jgi:GNAT superfamily N-acetyltransferase
MPVLPRVATSEDAETILVMMEEFYAEEGYPFDRGKALGALLPLLDDPSIGCVWMIEDAESAVGYFVLTLGWSLEYLGRDAFVDEIYVSPSHRGRGLGRLSLEVLEQACRALDVKALHLEVERENPAMGLYRKWGFADSDRLLMTKRLASFDPGASS